MQCSAGPNGVVTKMWDSACSSWWDEIHALLRNMVASPTSRVDFALAEALAFGTLALHRGAGPAQLRDDSSHRADASSPPLQSPQAGLNWGAYAVRLTGQDCERGTFNQRHAVLYDQATGAR